MIPKIIWQTYKLPKDELKPYMNEAMSTWIEKNPDYDHRYLSDQEALQFIADNYGKEWFDIFINVPLGVMRGDILRYMIIYTYGGIYTDLDTICLEPISTWIKNDFNFIVGLESANFFCQWTFAASPKHPILKTTLDLIKDNLKNANYKEKNFVYRLTGPGVWTKAIRKTLEMKEIALLDQINNIQLDFPKVKEYNFFSYGVEESKIFHSSYVKHLYASSTWNDGYDQWRKNNPCKVYADLNKVRWK